MNSAVDFAIDIEKLRASANQAAKKMHVLANPDRLLLLCQISLGERSVSQLEEQTGIMQPTLSQQLGVLRKENIVHTRRDGKYIYYSVADKSAMAILHALYQEYCQPNNS